jgi:two-component system, NarL family, nitrate/nitrite response regulator NarL
MKKSQGMIAMSIILIDECLLFGETLQQILSANDFNVALLNVHLNEIGNLDQVDQSVKLVLVHKKSNQHLSKSFIQSCKELWPNAKLAIISDLLSPADIKYFMGAGASGCISARRGLKSFIAAINFINAGEKYSPPLFFQNAELVDPAILSRKEQAVAIGVIEGKSNKEIGLKLDLAETTIKLHVKTLMRKLKAKNRTHAAIIVFTNNLLPQDEMEETLSFLNTQFS